MKYVALGTSGIHVSQLCLGTMTFGNPLDRSQCEKLVCGALDQGINFFDTANVYEGYDRAFGSCGGVGEEVLGSTLVQRRQEAIICTKFGNPVGTGPLDAGLSARHLEAQLDKSLKRLRTDWIDLVMAHRWDPSVPVEEVCRVFDRWVRAGKVRCVGVSNWPAWRIAQACEIVSKYGWPPVSVISPKYSLLSRGIELEHIACAVNYGAALVTYQPFEGGILTGKYRRRKAFPEKSRGAEKPEWVPKLKDAFFDKLDALEALAREAGISLPQYLIAWALSRPALASVVIGCRNSEQLDTAVVGAQKSIPPEHFPQIDLLFPPPGPLAGEQVLYWRDRVWTLENLEG